MPELRPEASPHGEDHPEKLSSMGAVSHLSTRKFAERTKVLPWETEGSSWLPGKSVVSQLGGEALLEVFLSDPFSSQCTLSQGSEQKGSPA